MPSKNDITKFLSEGKDQQAAPVKQPSPFLAPNPVGRPAKSPAEKESEIVAIKLTKSEIAMLEEKAGLVPKSTFLKHILRNNTDVFK